MAVESVIRKRKPGNISRPMQGTAIATRTRRMGLVGLALRLVCVCLIGILGYLFYAYAASPTSAVIITDAHDVTTLAWTQVHNDYLEYGTKILKELEGPESIVVDEAGNWYTGVRNGQILKISNGQNESCRTVSDITVFANYTAGKERMERRALGLRLVEKQLYIADAHQGIFVVDIDTYKWDKIVGYDEVSPILMLANDLSISSDGKTIYFIDVSTRWMYHEHSYTAIEGECSGRVLKVNIALKKVQILREGLCLPNGIQLNTHETKLLVSEFSRSRIAVLDINSGETLNHVLLPGGGDNIRQSKSGGYWVPVPAALHPALQLVNNYPFARDIAASVLGPEGLYKLFDTNQGTVIKLDENLEPVHVHYDRSGKVCQALTEVQEYEKGRFLLGSFSSSGIVMLDGPPF